MAGYFNELTSENEKTERQSALVDETVKFVRAIQVMRPMTDLEIRVIIFDDTTEKTISFIVYYPANYPDVKKKMLNEIDRIFKMTNSSITENDVNNLTYRGYQWSTETIIRINIDAINNNEEYWE
ncbi:hypothetical protein RhiirA5_425002 [Rhizophagus irregularis]|uniref:Uncharacterized protein n=1 Tax=Rhizophagus irregularis TaxID=588596 RepID=A0A2I1FCS1_9GLOM|nr:hypothetical protein RhiirA5_425002 [Rhizophagus irregularis]PKY32185.1 hypothetical protein RhiirB3_450189 [Rhizophagus irregularis]